MTIQTRKIKVTQEDMDKGVPQDCEHCAIAVALKREYKTRNAEVRLHGSDATPVLVVDGKELNIPVSYENIILDFMSEYDKQYDYATDEEYYSRHNPQPFEFEVNVIWKS